MKERLDRAVANPSWCDQFQDVDVSVLATQNSDHCPLLLSYGTRRVEDLGISDHFKFEASWMVNEACTKVIEDSWKGSHGIGDPLEVLIGKLEHCKRSLLKWSKSRGRKKRLSMAEEANREN
jgi:hypothetical protein